MYSTHKTSFLTLLVLSFLLPIFFVPSLLVPLGVGKTILIALALVVMTIAFLVELLRQGGVSLPKSHIMWIAVALPVVYLLSALSSPVPSMSLFGYSFEIGTFAAVLMFVTLFLITSLVVTDTTRLMRVYAVSLISLGLVVLFSLVKVFSHGTALSFKVFTDITSNPIGVWTDLPVALGLMAILSIFAIEMVSLKKLSQVLLYVGLVLSVVLMVIFDFSVAWYITCAGALVALVYFVTVERSSVTTKMGSWNFSRLLPAAALFLIALLFSINPTLSAKGPIGNVISGHYGLATSDVRPSFSSTMEVTKGVLAQNGLLGSGPNTFSRDWLQFKPSAINGTAYWNVAFLSGVGYLPTVPATVGIIGSIVWLAFLILILLIGAKSLRGIGQNQERFALVSTLVGTLFLWSVAIFYSPSVTIIALAFLWTGLFIASARFAGVIPTGMVVFRRSPALNFISVLIIIVLGIGSLAFLLTSYQRLAAVVHYEKALALSHTEGSSVDDIERELDHAITLAPSDLYYGSLSELAFARAQGVLQNPTTTPAQTQSYFQSIYQQSIAAADQATKLNPGNYLNWTRLGNVYSALVPAPLSVSGAYESALASYKQAQALSPENPEPSLLQARLEINHNNPTTARADIQNSIAKKQDYVDAYFLLTQLDVQQGNTAEAIQAAQATAILSPGNAGVFFELGLLQYNNHDYNSAAQALAQAIKIVPEYANAKYFLGLSLDKLNDHADAIALFQDLAKSNPTNQDVASILANLQAGKDAFYKAPASASRPEKRATPPIANTETQE
jgi:tetratricopeptide (TPR) repeat protein